MWLFWFRRRLLSFGFLLYMFLLKLYDLFLQLFYLLIFFWFYLLISQLLGVFCSRTHFVKLLLVHEGFNRSAVAWKQYFFVFDARNVSDNKTCYRFFLLCFKNESWASRDIFNRMNFNRTVIPNNYNIICIFKCRKMDKWDWSTFITT